MRVSPFSTILIFAVLVIAGAGLSPLLNVQYTPTQKQESLTVSFNWPGASARVIESEATSKLEGLIASVSGVNSIKSVSKKESGSVTIDLKENAKSDVVRYEIASLIRRLYSKLPEGVTYPVISASSSGENLSPVLIYTINASMPTNKIGEYVQENIVKDISLIPGSGSSVVSGVTPVVIEVTFSPELLNTYSITTSDLSAAIGSYTGTREIIGNIDGTSIILTSDIGREEMEMMPVKNSAGRIIRLGDVAKIAFKESTPSFYYRVNGLNTVNITIYPEKGVNTIILCKKIKEKINNLSKKFPDNFSAILTYDASKYLNNELNKILRRTFLSVFILLLFVFITSKSLRYLIIIFVTLLANISIALIFYYFLKLEIHIYSLAGITVSLGMVIDSSIMMISHYGYFRNRKIFLAILAALLTTIGALSIIFFLPTALKENLLDFSAVIIINLGVSLAIAMFLIPALIDKYPIKGVNSARKFKTLRKNIKFNYYYKRFLSFGKKHKLAFIVILVLAFGLPVHLLPEKIENDDSFGAKFYNKTIGSSFYQNTLKKPVEKMFGGTLRLFTNNMRNSNLYREPMRTTLYIRASMPEGCTIAQLNEIVVYMENYLSQFKEIDMFKTQILSYRNGQITVTFKKEFEGTGFPLFLKNSVISKAIDFGGANWSVYGIDENGFSNNVSSAGYKSNRIVVTGYNYDLLYNYCLESVGRLSENIRVNDPGVFGEVGWNMELSKNEYYIDYDFGRLASLGISPINTYSALNRELAYNTVANYFDGYSTYPIRLLSAHREGFDVWNLNNEHIDIGGKSVKFSELGKIEKRRTGNDIYKIDQQYSLLIAYDFIGPYELAKKVLKRENDRLNSTLPMGFKAETKDLDYNLSNEGYFWILFIVIAIIFTISAVLFESLIQPLIIISLIPVSFIGVFLTFYFTDFTFDQGGLAALIMLSGISVNAGIYIMNQYNLLKKNMRYNKSSIDLYIKAFNLKIVPILLTVLSTVLGLVPFLFDGKNEVFWFAFAVGTMGGLLFSVLGILIFLPVWQKN